jgi:hypothetical protein
MLCRDFSVDRRRSEFYDVTVGSHTRSRQLFESLHPRHQDMIVHLREYANIVSWSQATTAKSVKENRSAQAPDRLQNMFSFDALIAVSA